MLISGHCNTRSIQTQKFTTLSTRRQPVTHLHEGLQQPFDVVLLRRGVRQVPKTPQTVLHKSLRRWGQMHTDGLHATCGKWRLCCDRVMDATTIAKWFCAAHGFCRIKNIACLQALDWLIGWLIEKNNCQRTLEQMKIYWQESLVLTNIVTVSQDWWNTTAVI